MIANAVYSFLKIFFIIIFWTLILVCIIVIIVICNNNTDNLFYIDNLDFIIKIFPHYIQPYIIYLLKNSVQILLEHLNLYINNNILEIFNQLKISGECSVPNALINKNIFNNFEITNYYSTFVVINMIGHAPTAIFWLIWVLKIKIKNLWYNINNFIINYMNKPQLSSSTKPAPLYTFLLFFSPALAASASGSRFLNTGDNSDSSAFTPNQARHSSIFYEGCGAAAGGEREEEQGSHSFTQESKNKEFIIDVSTVAVDDIPGLGNLPKDFFNKYQLLPFEGADVSAIVPDEIPGLGNLPKDHDELNKVFFDYYTPSKSDFNYTKVESAKMHLASIREKLMLKGGYKCKEGSFVSDELKKQYPDYNKLFYSSSKPKVHYNNDNVNYDSNPYSSNTIYDDNLSSNIGTLANNDYFKPSSRMFTKKATSKRSPLINNDIPMDSNQNNETLPITPQISQMEAKLLLDGLSDSLSIQNNSNLNTKKRTNNVAFNSPEAFTQGSASTSTTIPSDEIPVQRGVRRDHLEYENVKKTDISRFFYKKYPKELILEKGDHNFKTTKFKNLIPLNYDPDALYRQDLHRAKRLKLNNNESSTTQNDDGFYE